MEKTDITEGGIYYIPEWEEMKIGLTYEFLREGGAWEERILDPREDMFDLGWIWTFLMQQRIRVKYLDHEDIVECGWRDGTDLNGRRIYHNGDRLLIIYPASNRVNITYPIGGLKPGEEAPVYNLYDGNILNRSELKFIMKRLGINPTVPG